MMIDIVFLSPSLVAAASIQVLCQIFKVFYYSIRERRLQLRRLLHPAGMPSAHSAFVTALTTSIAVYNGIASELFALSFVFSIIIIYDSIRLRGAVQTHSEMIHKLSQSLPQEERIPVSQLVGHTLAEIVVGVLLGFVWALILGLFVFRRA